jgi:DNA-binding NtrC family response regulator
MRENLTRPVSTNKNRHPLQSLNGKETILVVEDDFPVRQLVIEMLTMTGYKVLEAHCGEQAIEHYKVHQNTINLVLTDVVMPEMSGKKLVEHLNNIHPCKKVLYMSGYTGNEIDNQGLLEPDIHFIQKPFTPSDLITKIRFILDN